MAKDDKILTRAEADAAIAIFDDLNDRTLLANTDKLPGVNKWRENNGTAALRDKAISDAPFFESVWAGLTDDEQQAFVWDFEFVPVLNDLRDWDHGGALPDLEASVAAMRAWLAEHAPDDTLKGFPVGGADVLSQRFAPPALPPQSPAPTDTPERRADGLVLRVTDSKLPGFEHMLAFDSYAARDAVAPVLRQLGFCARVALADADFVTGPAGQIIKNRNGAL